MSLLKIKRTKSLYLVYPAALTDYEFEQAETVFNRVEALSGARPIFICDRELTDGKTIPDGAPAVLIGQTVLPESRELLAGLTYGEAEIKLIGNRIVINAYTDNLLPALVSELTENMSYTDGETVFHIKEHRIHDNRYLHTLPVMDGGRLVAYRDSREECDMLVFADADESIYRNYTEKLAGRFEKLWERNIEGNLFTAFRDKTVAVHAYFTPYNNHIRVVVEPVANLYIQRDERFTAVTTPNLTLMGRRFSTTARYLGKDSGAGQMSYCIRLSDGSFIVYDGGLATDGFADGIYDVMKAGAPDPENIVIAAWIISHSHNDHIGGFVKFAPKYADKVKLERLLCNFPSLKDASTFREQWNERTTKETLYKYFPDTVFSKLHTGDFLKIRDAEFEVLYCQEDYVRQYIAIPNDHNWNNTSLVTRMTLGGTTVMFMADAQDNANNIITAMYPKSFLKADILQVCHHGGVGGTIALYEAIDPDVAIFSTTDALLPEYLAVSYNNHLVYDLNVKQIFNSAENTITLDLPYKIGPNNIPEFHGKIVPKL